MVVHRIAGRKLGRDTAERKALLRSLTTSLVFHGRIVTTLPKAKELRSHADHMAKKGTLAARREASSWLFPVKTAENQNVNIVSHVFSKFPEYFKDRQGGYTRVLKLNERRKGDDAPLALIEYILPADLENSASPSLESSSTESEAAKS